MAEAKLKAGFMVRAILRHCASLGLSGVVVHKGDEDAGAILIKSYKPGVGSVVYSQTRDADAKLIWIRSTGAGCVDESKADQVIMRARDVDYDLWVIEIELASHGSELLEGVLGIQSA